MKKVGVKKAMVGSDWTGDNPGGTKKCKNPMCNIDIPGNTYGCPYCGAIQ